jgi:TolB-like protein/Tfp pilus assembly protein PilF
MSQAIPTPLVFRFGRFELDLHARELRKDGVRTRLQDQPFELLTMLVERPGEILTREELRQRLWGNGTFVDFEHGLNAAVKRLRGVLGDTADHPRFVETLHRRGYRFVGPVERLGPRGERLHARSAATAYERPRLAILPFSDLTEMRGDGSGDYFSDGLRDEMIARLGRLCAGRIGVIARTSTSLVRRTATTIRDISQRLRADFVVEGSIRRDADRVRITVHLIESRGETELWAESYDRQLADCFEVQSEVAGKIAHSLTVELLPGGAGPAGTRHVGAHQAYLKGRYHWNQPGDVGLAQAIAYFEQAIALDREFSAAHSALGRAQLSAADYYLFEPRVALAAARRAARRALEIDPTDAEAHLTLAEVQKTVERDWSRADVAYRTALAFNPSNTSAHRHYGLFLAACGRIAEALTAADRACDLDPLCLVVNTSAAWVRYVAGDYARAIEHCRHTLDMDASFGPARRLLAAALLQIGRGDEAVTELETFATTRLDPVSLAWLAHIFGARGDNGRAAHIVVQLEQIARERFVSPYHRALAHGAAGDRDGALRLLAQAFDDRDPAIINVAVDPRFRALVGDPRYKALVDRLALPN